MSKASVRGQHERFRPEMMEVLRAAEQIMRESPRLDVGIAIYRAGVKSQNVQDAKLLDDLLTIDERSSTELAMIRRLKQRPEVLSR